MYKVTVLIGDDEVCLAEALGEIIIDGIQFLVATTVEEINHQLQYVDAAVLDVNMPHSNKLIIPPGKPHVRITGNLSSAAVTENVALVKPFNVTDFINIVRLLAQKVQP